MSESQDVLLTVKEYAALFQRHEQTVYSAIRRDRLPYPIERPTGGGFMIRVPREIVDRLRAA